MQLQSHGISHVGLKRTQNQDSFLVNPELSLFIVADGMGGHKGGETASRLAVETISHFFQAFTATTVSQNPGEKLKQSIVNANEMIQKESFRKTDLSGMGTTTTALFFDRDHAWIAQVGDSRAYLVQPQTKEIWQLTRDHSIVQEKLRARLINQEQAKSDRMKNVITRSVGFEAKVDVDLYNYKPRPGDLFMLCSDGLTGMMDDEIILKTILENGTVDLQKTAQALVDLANHNGGDDNVTVVLIHCN